MTNGSRPRIFAFDKPKSANALTIPVTTYFAKAIAEHRKARRPPIEFQLRVRKMPEAINPRTGKPYFTSFVVESFLTSSPA